MVGGDIVQKDALSRHPRDVQEIKRVSGIRDVEYGYLKGVIVKGTDDAARVESAPDKVSRYEVVEGHMPRTNDEIARDSFMDDEYPIGSKTMFTEKAGIGGMKVLKCHIFKVVGLVNSMAS